MTRAYAATLTMLLIILAWVVALAVMEVAGVAADWIEGLIRWVDSEFA